MPPASTTATAVSAMARPPPIYARRWLSASHARHRGAPGSRNDLVAGAAYRPDQVVAELGPQAVDARSQSHWPLPHVGPHAAKIKDQAAHPDSRTAAPSPWPADCWATGHGRLMSGRSQRLCVHGPPGPGVASRRLVGQGPPGELTRPARPPPAALSPGRPRSGARLDRACSSEARRRGRWAASGTRPRARSTPGRWPQGRQPGC